MATWLRKAVTVYTAAVEALVALCFGGMALVALLGVIARSVPGFPPLGWTEEVTLFLMVAAVFLAAGLAIRKGLHLEFDLLVTRLPGRWRRLVITLNYLLVIGFLAVVLVAGIPLALDNMGQRSAALELPMGIPYMAMPIGALLMMGECLARIAQAWAPDGLAAGESHGPGEPGTVPPRPG